MKQDLLLLHHVAIQADAFYGEGERFGQWAAKALGGRRRAQLTGLEGVANSTLKVSDVLDYLKKQTARSKAGEAWRHGNPEGKELGPELIDYIRGSLRGRWEGICQSVASDTKQAIAAAEKQKVYLDLIREFLRQVAAQYELEVSHRDF